MRVAQFIHRYPPALGGAEAWAERLSRHLVAQGHDVEVWTTTAIDLQAFSRRGRAETPPGTETRSGVTVRRYRPEWRILGRRWLGRGLSLWPGNTWRAMTQAWSPTTMRMWRDAGRAAPVDVVHAMAFPHASILYCALRLAQIQRVPFVVTPFMHWGDPNDPNNGIRRAYTARHLVAILRAADRVLVQTPTELRAVTDLGIAAERVILQGLGVDASECTGGDRERARHAWGIRADEVVVGHLANLSVEKGTPDLLAAAARVRDRGTSIRVVLAGALMPSTRSFRQWRTHGAWITQLGPLSADQRRDFYAGIDVFALPSRSDSFGLVFLEAWANGVPVIGYRSGGVPDVIRHEVDGLLVPCGDRAELAKAIERCATGSGVRACWGRAGQEKLPLDYAWDDKLRVAEVVLTRQSSGP